MTGCSSLVGSYVSSQMYGTVRESNVQECMKGMFVEGAPSSLF